MATDKQSTQGTARALVAALGLLALAPSHGLAQDAPDIRTIKPAVMLMLDTSGSMERLASCACSTQACNECLPTCGVGAEKNRWGTVSEALTGTWDSFACTEEDRSGPGYTGAVDYGYYIPHYRLPSTTQNDNGILDVYVTRIKFGLMTFDGMGTLSGEAPLIEPARFTAPAFLTKSQSSPGMFSYGSPKEFIFPGCETSYMIDNGARGTGATSGGLISVGDDTITNPETINANIQSSLLGVRPYGATPIAGMLDDLRYYVGNHPDVIKKSYSTAPGDPFYSCRKRYALLITDGYPNADFRGEPYYCETPGFQCPYDSPEEIASDLCQADAFSGACTGVVDGLYVIGFDIGDDAAVSRLNDIASVGGTEKALFANDYDTLMQRLAEALDAAAPGTTTRTVPAFARAGSSGTSQAQMEFTTGFKIAGDGEPWSGVLERRRFECDEHLEPVPQPISSQEDDRFQEVLNQRTAPRKLLTVIPNDAANIGSHLGGASTGVPSLNSTGGRGGGSDAGAGGAPAGCSGTVVSSTLTPTDPVESGLQMQAFDTTNAQLTAELLGVDGDDRSELINWVHGKPGSDRESKKLGDIYHSSPVVVGPPSQDIPDESYNLFRETVSRRPTVVYVGSNDGILHAFSATDGVVEDGNGVEHALKDGEELWGFIPPMLIDKLRSARNSHQWMVDGTAVVKDVFLTRAPGAAASGSNYRTVLMMGFRGGASGYFALDVTDPLNPEFLWQFSNENVGPTYGDPGLGQVLVEANGQLQERGIAVLTGGRGNDLSASAASCGPEDSMTGKTTGCAMQGKGAPEITDNTDETRGRIRCWDTPGRHLFILDVATGKVLRHLDDRAFNAPLGGGVALFTGDVGTVATRAFTTDEDGIVWRIDLSSPRMSDWDATPFHDIFHDVTAADGQPAYFAPILSSDKEGNVVVLQATGNIDELDRLVPNRVISLSEEISFDASAGTLNGVTGKLNWEIQLRVGEQVTGPLELFDGRLYFGSFRSTSDPTNACALGDSQIWGVDYIEAESLYPKEGIENDDGVLKHFLGPYTNQIVMGVAITQRPSCFEGVTEVDPYFGTRFKITQSGGGNFQLVANVSGGGSKTAGGSVAQITRDLEPPLAYTQVESWAGSVD